jgi:hypothetical protein
LKIAEFPSELAVLFGWNSGVGLSGPGNTVPHESSKIPIPVGSGCQSSGIVLGLPLLHNATATCGTGTVTCQNCTFFYSKLLGFTAMYWYCAENATKNTWEYVANFFR